MNFAESFKHWSQYFSLKLQGWTITRYADIFSFPHRFEGYQFLRICEQGLEIGAFNCPAALPPSCRVKYCDLQSKESALKLFPEIDGCRLVEVEQILNLDLAGLSCIADHSQDFVVANHVLEHVANPLRVLAEIFRVLKAGGIAVLSIPDKEFSFDKPRVLTPYEHLLQEYQDNVLEVTDAHYLDFVKAVYPTEFAQGPVAWTPHFEAAKSRHEHAHVWNSESFLDFLQRALGQALNGNAELLYQSTGSQNSYEYFSVWKKI